MDSIPKNTISNIWYSIVNCSISCHSLDRKCISMDQVVRLDLLVLVLVTVAFEMSYKGEVL